MPSTHPSPSPPATADAAAADPVATRAEVLLRQTLFGIRSRTDRSFALLMVIQWVVCVAAAWWVSTHGTWDSSATIHTRGHLLEALIVGGIITSLPAALGMFRPGLRSTRYAFAVGQMLMSALIIHIADGRIEAHFHVFGSLAFLAFYLDWPVLIIATLVITADHLIRGMYMPASVFGTAVVEPYRWLEHFAWLAFIDLFLIVGSHGHLYELRQSARRQAMLEAQNAMQTEHTRARAASEQRFRQLAEHLGQVLWVLDRKTEALLYISPAYERTWGRGRSEVYADPRSIFAAVHPDDRDRLRAAFTRQIRGGAAVAEEVRVVRPDGAIRWVQTRSFVLEEDDGSDGRIAGVAEDVTERKEEEVRRVQELDRERRVAAVLQASLLMEPAPGSLPGVGVEAFHIPARAHEAQVSGDFFDAFPIEADRLGETEQQSSAHPLVALVVGDISGKGLAAAARTAEVKYALRAYLRDCSAAADAMSRLNRFVCETQALEERQFGTFIALSVVVFDPITGDAEVVQAGAEPALVLRHAADPSSASTAPGPFASVETIGDVTTGGLPLGTDPLSIYDSLQIHLEPGDVLLICSDGVSEARSASGDMLGTEGLVRLLAEAGKAPYGAPLRVTGDILLSGARSFTGGAFQDDVCILLARAGTPVSLPR